MINSCRQTAIATFAFLFGVLVVSFTRGDDLNPITKELVSLEYPKALAKLEAKFDHCHGEGVLLTTRKSRGGASAETTSKVRVQFAFSGENGLLINTSLGDPRAQDSTTKDDSAKVRPYETVLGYTAKSSYSLTKKTPSSEYVVRWLNAEPNTARKEIIRGAGQLVFRPTMVSLTAISDFFKSPEFHLEKVVELLTEDRTRRLRIEFTNPRRPGAPANAMATTSGWFVVSPENQWMLHEYGVSLTSPNSRGITRIGHLQYKSDAKGELIPVNFDCKIYAGVLSSDPESSNLPADLTSSEEFRFEKFEFGDTPEEKFRLSAFGLPEFGQTVTQATAARSNRWWYLGGAVGLGVVALVLRRLSKGRGMGRVQTSAG
jgi:hypothetical protein